MLVPQAWGQGHHTEGGRAIRDEAFGRLRLEIIVAEHHPNVAAGRVIEKPGTRRESAETAS
jgi:RimJ/RimL family protein N-acetyltransferase